MKLILVRHAQTHLNNEKRLQGKGSDDELNEYGVLQAKKTREFLKDYEFDAIFSSPQKRAIQTAMIINKHHKKDIIIHKDLVERDFGLFEGKLYDEIDAYEIFTNKRHKEFEVETEDDFEDRVMKFFDYLHKNYFGKTVLIVSHGGTLKMLISKLQDMSWVDGLYNIKQDNAAVSIIEIDENRKVKKIDVNSNKHLE